MFMERRSEMGTRSSRKNRMKPVLFISWLLLVPMTVFAQTDHTHSPSSAEDCAKLSPALQAVIGAMDGAGRVKRVKAGGSPKRYPKPESASTAVSGTVGSISWRWHFDRCRRLSSWRKGEAEREGRKPVWRFYSSDSSQGWCVQDFCRRTHLDQCDRRKPTDRTGQNYSSFALRPDSQEPGVSVTTRKILLAGAVGEHTSGRGAARDGRVRSLKRRQYGKTQPCIDASGPGCGVHRS